MKELVTYIKTCEENYRIKLHVFIDSAERSLKIYAISSPGYAEEAILPFENIGEIGDVIYKLYRKLTTA